ncbi:MAG: glutamate 5-kinase [Clostridia bacterium]|nr:glutamate 5-kinase [Clostridia bacterium]
MRIVIKVGTSTLAHPGGLLNIKRVEQLCKVISDLKNSGHDIVLVSSGAIGMGVGKLRLKEKPADITAKQAAAAVGQCELMYTYDKLFSEYSHTVAQILITGADFENKERYTNFVNTINKLLEFSALPVINENDTVATEEIKVGDNDTISAMVAVSVNADLLILLSDIDGLFTADPHVDPNASLISVVSEIDDKIISLAGGRFSSLGTGGMITKLKAAQICTSSGCDMVIANGKNPDNLYGITEGKSIGTRFIKKQVD